MEIPTLQALFFRYTSGINIGNGQGGTAVTRVFLVLVRQEREFQRRERKRDSLKKDYLRIHVTRPV